MVHTAPPRDRLIAAAIDLVRRHGVAGTSVADLLATSGTARNSIYQHFPGGKDGLITASTTRAGDLMTTYLRRLIADRGTLGALDGLVTWWRRELTESDFAVSCPIAAAAACGDDGPTAAAAAAYTQWQALIAESAGAELDDDAPVFAATAVAAITGAVLAGRALRSTAPLDDAAAGIAALHAALSHSPSPDVRLSEAPRR